jgi:hypothetical protein
MKIIKLSFLKFGLTILLVFFFSNTPSFSQNDINKTIEQIQKTGYSYKDQVKGVNSLQLLTENSKNIYFFDKNGLCKGYVIIPLSNEIYLKLKNEILSKCEYISKNKWRYLKGKIKINVAIELNNDGQSVIVYSRKI